MSAGDRLKNNMKKSAENKVNSAVKENENLTTKKGLSSRSETFFKEPLDIEGFLDGSAEAPYEATIKPSLYEGTHENILHKFATYTTLFTLSGISEEELQDHTFLKNTVHDVIARSGGISDPALSGTGDNDLTQAGPQIDQKARENEMAKNAREVLEKGRDIFIESVNMVSTVGPSEERGLADFVKMEFKLHEPYGISFVEKMRAAARINKYRDHLDAPILLTIEFKGFDENGTPMGQYGTVRKIPILITRVDLDVNEGGAIYDVTAVRINDIAFDDRFKFPRCVITINASTLESAGKQLSEQLNEQILKERDKDKVREVLDEYRIVFDPEVLDLARGYIGGRNVQNTRVSGGGSPGQQSKIEMEVGEAQISSLVSITKLLEDMVRGTKGYEDLATDFWTQYLRRTNTISQREDASSETITKFIESDKFEKTIETNPFVDWFKIKTSVRTDYGQFDKINKMHRKIVTYRVIPFKIHVLKFMRPGVFMKSGIVKNNILKRYNYLYTGENTDIQNLRINYKTAYYMKNTVEVSKGPDSVFEKIDTLISKLRGNEDPDNNDRATLRSYPNITKGRSVFNTDIADTGKEARKQDFYDYLTNPTVDMMRIEMEILGDPAYLCQDQFIPLNARDQARRRGKQFDQESGSFNADSHTPLMELIYRLPDDINDKTGVMFEKNSTVPEENLFFAGVYQVVKIDSSMSNGQFLQTLTCVRLNNQNGLGTEASLLASAAGKLTDAFTDEYLKNSKRQLDESLKNEAKKIIKQGINKIEDYIK
jgi:hypothetical protein